MQAAGWIGRPRKDQLRRFRNDIEQTELAERQTFIARMIGQMKAPSNLLYKQFPKICFPRDSFWLYLNCN